MGDGALIYIKGYFDLDQCRVFGSVVEEHRLKRKSSATLGPPALVAFFFLMGHDGADYGVRYAAEAVRSKIN
jgi:hypothetical protein